MAEFSDEERAQIHAELDKMLVPQGHVRYSKGHYLHLDALHGAPRFQRSPGLSKASRGLCKAGGCTEARVNKTHCELHRDLTAAVARRKFGWKPRGPHRA